MKAFDAASSQIYEIFSNQTDAVVSFCSAMKGLVFGSFSKAEPVLTTYSTLLCGLYYSEGLDANVRLSTISPSSPPSNGYIIQMAVWSCRTFQMLFVLLWSRREKNHLQQHGLKSPPPSSVASPWESLKIPRNPLCGVRKQPRRSTDAPKISPQWLPVGALDSVALW